VASHKPAPRLETRDRGPRALLAPIEDLRHLLLGHAACELDQTLEDRVDRFGRPETLRRAHRLGVAADEEVVCVVVVLAALADGAYAREVHQALQLLDRLGVLEAAFRRGDAELRAHPLGLRLAALREEVDDTARDVGEPARANVVEVIVGLAGTAER